MMKVRTVDLEVKKRLWDEIIEPTITYTSKTWTWSEIQRSQDTSSGNEPFKRFCRKENGW